MHTRRTAPMLTLALLNGLAGLLAVVFGSLMLFTMLRIIGDEELHGALAGQEGNLETSINLMARFSSVVALFAVVGGAVTLAASIGLARMAPWGRTLTILVGWCAVALIPSLEILRVLQGEEFTLALGAVGYWVLALSLLHSREWRTAFTPRRTDDPLAAIPRGMPASA